jgi:hypothetical protein
MNKRILFLICALLLCCFCFQIYTISFGLPGIYNRFERSVAYWNNDEVKEIATIQSLLQSKAGVMHFNYPPLQYLLVSATLFPVRLVNGQLPAEWMLSLTSRLFSALSITASSLFVFLIGRRFHFLCGFISALFFAFSPIAAVVGRDIKPIGLSCTFVLFSLYLCLIVLDQASTVKDFRKIGSGLGLASMNSHLAVTFFHLPLLAYWICIKAQKRSCLGPLDHTTQQAKKSSRGRVLLVSLGAASILMSASLWLCWFQQDFILRLAQNIYKTQDHVKPFESHLPLIRNYLAQGRNIMAIGLLACISIFLYLLARSRIRLFRRLTNLNQLEAAYLWMGLSIFFILILSSILNPLIPVSILNFINSARDYIILNAGYYGMYPGELKPPSFFLGIFPCTLGIPLLVCSIAGLVYWVFECRKRLDMLFLLIAFAPLTLQILNWNTTFRASRFAFNLNPFLCLTAGLLISRLCGDKRVLIKYLGWISFVVIFSYTSLFAWAYTATRQYPQDVRVRGAEWIVQEIGKEKSIGVKARCDLPRNLGPVEDLPGYRYLYFEDSPDYCIMDGFEFNVLKLYFKRTGRGYSYVKNDWWPSGAPPGIEQIAAYDQIMNKGGYRLVKLVESEPAHLFQQEFNLEYLLDPAEFLHRKIYIFQKVE